MAATTSATVSMPPIAVDTAAFSTSATMPTAANTKETVKLTTPDAMEVIAFKVFQIFGPQRAFALLALHSFDVIGPAEMLCSDATIQSRALKRYLGAIPPFQTTIRGVSHPSFKARPCGIPQPTPPPNWRWNPD